nr:hypothetical protein [uncultured Chitinophaga sp.]
MVPLRDAAEKILLKRFNRQIPAVSNPEFNRHIKEVAQLATPVELTMKISGHKSLRDFYRYIRITPEEAGRKIREIWEKRGDIGITAITLVNLGYW